MLVAILIADLVFLQAAWKVLVWSTDGVVKRQDPAAMFCEGCMKQSYNTVSLQALPPNALSVGSRQSLASSRAESTQGLLSMERSSDRQVAVD